MSKLILMAICGIFASGSSNAATFSFQFEMPAFNKDFGPTAMVGKKSVLKIEVDNGKSDLKNQSYLFSDIESLTLVSLEGTSIANLKVDYLRAFNPNYDGIFLMTMGSGVAELNLTGSLLATGASAGVVLGSPDPANPVDFQLAAANSTNDFNPYEYYIRIDSLGIISVFDGPFTVRSNINTGNPLPSVPLPAGLPLLLTSLCGFGVMRWRRWRTA